MGGSGSDRRLRASLSSSSTRSLRITESVARHRHYRQHVHPYQETFFLGTSNPMAQGAITIWYSCGTLTTRG